MKTHVKNYLFYCLGILILTSACQSENTSSLIDDDSIIKPQQIVEVETAYNIYDTLTFEYNGNHLIKKTSNSGYITSYSYSGNNLVRIDMTDNQQKSTTYYKVENNSLGQITKASEYRLENGKFAHVSTYEYHYSGNIIDKWDYYDLLYNSNYTRFFKYDANGNIIEFSDYITDEIGTKKQLAGFYTYDDKNNPWKNIQPYNIPAMFTQVNNLVTEKLFSYTYVISSENTYQISDSQYLWAPNNYVINYNQNGYPVSIQDEGHYRAIIEY